MVGCYRDGPKIKMWYFLPLVAAWEIYTASERVHQGSRTSAAVLHLHCNIHILNKQIDHTTISHKYNHRTKRTTALQTISLDSDYQIHFY